MQALSKWDIGYVPFYNREIVIGRTQRGKQHVQVHLASR